MTRYILFCAAAVALLSSPGSAGEILVFPLPTQFVRQEITDIPVLMDVGFFVSIRDQDKLATKLQQKTIREYEGFMDVVIDTNFNLAVTCSITATGLVPGDYARSVTPARRGAGRSGGDGDPEGGPALGDLGLLWTRRGDIVTQLDPYRALAYNRARMMVVATL